MLRLRVLTAVVGIPLALAIIYAGGWWLVGATSLLAVLALREFYSLIVGIAHRTSGAPPPSVLTVCTAAGYVLAVVMPLAAIPGPALSLPHLALGIAALSHLAIGTSVLVALASPLSRSRSFAPYLAIPAGAFVLPLLFTCLVRLRLLEHEPLAGLATPLPPGACWLFLVFAACWAGDSAAYAVGRTWGHRKLWPTVSPGKTVEGALAGLLASIVIVAVLAWVFGVALYFGLALGVLMGVGGQLGDLAESKLKRWAGVKDSGSLLPGHGGVLDRFDSLLVNAPLAYFFLRAVLWG